MQVVATNQNMRRRGSGSGRWPGHIGRDESHGTPAGLPPLEDVEAARKFRMPVLLFEGEDRICCILSLNLYTHIIHTQSFKAPCWTCRSRRVPRSQLL